MAQYILKRVLSGALTILILMTVTFFLVHAIPGSPFVEGEQNMP